MAIIQSGATADLLTIHPTAKAARALLYDVNGNPIVRSAGEVRGATDGFLVTGGLNDDNYRFSRMDRMGNQAVALNNVLFSEPFEGATVSTPNRLTAAATTFVPAQTAAGGYSFNPTTLVTAAAAAYFVTNRRFVKMQRAPLHTKIRARISHFANAVAELGFGAPASQTVSPTTGAYWQVTTAGAVQPVLTYNGVDTVGTAVTMPGGWGNNFYTWDIILDDDEAYFSIQDTSTGQLVAERRIQLPAAAARLWDATRLPVYARLHNVTAPATAPAMVVTSLDVVLLDAFMNKPWAQTVAGMGLGIESNPTTFAQTAIWANSAAPSSATLSNTAAGVTALGGLFQFAAVAGAATDYALVGFTVPSPYTLVVTGIDIDTWNTGAAVATTPHLLVWGASPDQTAISLATATNRRVGIGSQYLPIGAVVGQAANRLSSDFSNSPLVTNPGRIFVVILRMPVATATGSQIIQGMVNIKGYFE